MCRLTKAIAAVVLLTCFVAGTTWISTAGAVDEEYLWSVINVDDPGVVLEGRWLEIADDQSLGGLEVTTTRSAAHAEFTFTGTGIRWIGSTGVNRGLADVYVNGELVAEAVDSYRPEGERGVVLFEMVDLEVGTHTLRIDPTGESHEEATMANVNIDALAFIPTLEEAIRRSERELGELREVLPYIYLEGQRPAQLDEALSATEAALREARAVSADEDSTPAQRQGALIAIHRALAGVRVAEPAYSVRDLRENLDEMQVVHIPRIDRRPVIDGILDDEAWMLASSRGGKVVIDLSEASPPDRWVWPRTGYIAYDDEALYVAFVVPDPSAPELYADGTSFSHNDEVEFFVIAPGMTEHVRLGICAAEMIDHRGLPDDEGVHMALSIEDGIWFVEMELQFSALEKVGAQRPGPGHIWRMNFCGRQVASGDQWMTWNATHGGFHNPDRFGIAVFGE